MSRDYAVTPGLEDGIDKAFSRTGLSLALLALVALYGWIEFKRARLRVLTRAVSGAGLASLKSAEQRLVFALPDEISDLAASIATLKRDVADYTGYLNSLAGKLSHELNTPLTSMKLRAQMRLEQVQRGDLEDFKPAALLSAFRGDERQIDRVARGELTRARLALAAYALEPGARASVAPAVTQPVSFASMGTAGTARGGVGAAIAGARDANSAALRCCEMVSGCRCG